MGPRIEGLGLFPGEEVTDVPQAESCGEHGRREAAGCCCAL